MLYIRTYQLTYDGHALTTCPKQYSRWRRLRAALGRDPLPPTCQCDRAVLTIRIQGPNPSFMDYEIRYRERFHLEAMRQIDPGAVHRRTLLLCETQNLTERPLRDRSTGQSHEYERWIAGFYASAPDGVIEDRKESVCTF